MLTRYVLLDLETVAAPDCREWLGEVTPPSNYSKPDTIAAYIRDETERLVSRAGLDADLCTIACVGIWPATDVQGSVILVTNDVEERLALGTVWQLCNNSTPMVGYGLTWFDLGVLVRRSQLLGVQVPAWVYKQGKYRHDNVIELADYLTLNGMIDQKKGRGLDYHCRRFRIHVDDDFSGKDVAALWAEGAHDAVMSHCLADLNRIQRLAERLHVIPTLSEQQDELREAVL